MNVKKAKQAQSFSFNEKFVELEKIYHLLQSSDDKNLDDTIALYEKGIKLATSLEKNIQSYEMRIQEVLQPSQDDSSSQPDVAGPPSFENEEEQKKTSKAKKESNDNAMQSFDLFTSETENDL